MTAFAHSETERKLERGHFLIGIIVSLRRRNPHGVFESFFRLMTHDYGEVTETRFFIRQRMLNINDSKH